MPSSVSTGYDVSDLALGQPVHFLHYVLEDVS